MRVAPIAHVCVLLAAGAAWGQGVGETIEVKGWRVHLSANADGTHTCAAMWQFGDHSAVGFAADTEQHTFLVLSQPEAALTVNRSYPARFRVDRGKAKAVAAVATSGVMAVLPIAEPDVDFAALGAGRTVTVDVDGTAYEKRLEGSHEAIRALGRCIAGAPAPPR